jgi:glutamyl-tRNA synthetase
MTNIDKPVVVRFAPSPTGGLHIGGIRTALFNYLFAKQNGGKFLVRIEDTDQKRFDPAAENHIFDTLEWLGLTPDESPRHNPSMPFRQSERSYKCEIQFLIDNGHAYYAFDTDEELEAARERWNRIGHRGGYNHEIREQMINSLTLPSDSVLEKLSNGTPYVVRFKMPKNETVTFKDGVRGLVTFNTTQLDDKVLMKSNGIPTYHGANVVDDHAMNITHIIRGEEWLSSTPLHIMLYKAFGWDIPEFYHLPLILDQNGKKFSKRTAIKLGISIFALNWTGFDEDSKEVRTLQGYKEMGIEKEAFLNYLVLLGWHPSDNTEIMEIQDMIEQFDITRINSAGAKFDYDKMKSLNAWYVRQLPVDVALAEMTDNFSNPAKTYSDYELGLIVDFAKERAVFRSDLVDTGKLFFGDITDLYDRWGDAVYWNQLVAKWDDTANDIYKQFIHEYATNKDIEWDGDSIKLVLTEITAKMGLKIGKALAPLRLAIAGGFSGPDLMTSCEILGKEETIRRIFYMIR